VLISYLNNKHHHLSFHFYGNQKFQFSEKPQVFSFNCHGIQLQRTQFIQRFRIRSVCGRHVSTI